MRLPLLAATLALAGCAPGAVTPRPGDAAPPAPPELGTAFAAAECGTVAGIVRWAGPKPEVPVLLGAVARGEDYTWVTRDHPFRPAVGPDAGLAHTFVWLEGVDPARSKPWDVSELALTIDDARFLSGGKPFRTGVVRTGSELAVTTADDVFYVFRGRGAAFFSHPIPGRDRPVRQRLPRPGVVELSSATTAYWMLAQVFVSNTPYAAVTGADGGFRLGEVPAGTYRLIVRHPSYLYDKIERDPESGLQTRLVARPAVRQRHTITVRPGGVTQFSTTPSDRDFHEARDEANADLPGD